MTNRTMDAIADAIDEMVSKGECSIVKKENSVVYKISPTQIGRRKGKSASIGEINKKIAEGIILGKEGREKRRYRRADQLPDPSMPGDAEVNRERVQIGARVTRDHRALFEKAARAFPSKGAAMEEAIRLLAKHTGVDRELD